MDNAQPIRLAYTGGLAYNLQSLERFLFQQAGSSIKTWLVLSDWDIDSLLQSVAARQVNDRQHALIQKMSAVKAHGLSNKTIQNAFQDAIEQAIKEHNEGECP